MEKKLTRLGVVIAVFGLAFFVAAGYAFVKTQEGTRALNAFSTAQAVSSPITTRASCSIMVTLLLRPAS